MPVAGAPTGEREDRESERAGSPHQMSALLVCSLSGPQPFGSPHLPFFPFFSFPPAELAERRLQLISVPAAFLSG